MLGPNEHGQEILIMAEYLRLKQFTSVLLLSLSDLSSLHWQHDPSLAGRYRGLSRSSVVGRP
jgi:hypothetical protein